MCLGAPLRKRVGAPRRHTKVYIFCFLAVHMSTVLDIKCINQWLLVQYLSFIISLSCHNINLRYWEHLHLDVKFGKGNSMPQVCIALLIYS